LAIVLKKLSLSQNERFELMTFIQYSLKQHLFSLTVGRVVLVDCEGIGAIFSSSTVDFMKDFSAETAGSRC
jgi:hypothetical protein